jgi:hypothetical protein
MKKKIMLTTILVILMGLFYGCGATTEEKSTLRPEQEQIQAICKLSTLECYYHNVAKMTKTKGTGIMGIGEKDREYWVEYTGIAKVGIDMSKVKMTMGSENNITIYLPEAELMQMEVKEGSEKTISSEDGWNKNEITADDQTAVIQTAQEEMEATIKENAALLMNAQNRAKTLIENYITRLGEAVGVTYEIEWVYETETNTEESTGEQLE